MYDLHVKAGNQLLAASKLVGLTGIKEDLNVVNDYCEEAMNFLAGDVANVEFLDERGRTWLHAFYTSALIAYARCFNGGGRTRLQEVHVRRASGDEAGEAIAVHRVMILTRDKHIAHSVSPYEEGICGIIARPDGTIWGIDTHLYQQSTAPNAFDQLRLLVAHLLPLVNDMILDARADVLRQAQELTREEILALDDAEWIPAGLPDLTATRSTQRTIPEDAYIYSWHIEVDEAGLVEGQVSRMGPDGPDRRRKSVTVSGNDRDTVWGDLGTPER